MLHKNELSTDQLDWLNGLKLNVHIVLKDIGKWEGLEIFAGFVGSRRTFVFLFAPVDVSA